MATKNNYKFPGTTAQAEAASALADARIETNLGAQTNGVEIVVPSTAIKIAV